MRKFLVMILPLFVAACAAPGEPRDRQDEQAVYESHAGGAESWVRYTSVRNWRSVGFHSVVFELDRSRHYLVTLVGACGLDLNSSPTLKIVGSRRNVLSEFDQVVVRGQPCQIQSIRRLDIDAVDAELESGSGDLNAQGEVEVEIDDQSSGGT